MPLSGHSVMPARCAPLRGACAVLARQPAQMSWRWVATMLAELSRMGTSLRERVFEIFAPTWMNPPARSTSLPIKRLDLGYAQAGEKANGMERQQIVVLRFGEQARRRVPASGCREVCLSTWPALRPWRRSLWRIRPLARSSTRSRSPGESYSRFQGDREAGQESLDLRCTDRGNHPALKMLGHLLQIQRRRR